MGDYSVICAVTGLPITRSQKVIGLELEPYRWPENNKYRYVPKSWPVAGEYDMMGGIEGLISFPSMALIHQEVWDNAPLFWHSDNHKTGPVFLDVQHALNRGRMFTDSPDYTFTDRDHLYYALQGQFTETDEGLTLRDMLDAKACNVTNSPKGWSFIERGAFTELMLGRMLAGWTDADQDTLYHLVCLWSGQMLTGRQIAPSNQPYIEQYPDYKQRIKLLRFTSGLASRLSKNKD